MIVQLASQLFFSSSNQSSVLEFLFFAEKNGGKYVMFAPSAEMEGAFPYAFVQITGLRGS